MSQQENQETNSVEETIANMDSILESVKKIIGLERDYDAFDPEIIIHINTVFSNLTQMGIGNKDGFEITGYDEEWGQLELTSKLKTQQVKTYIALKVKSIFDPPSNGNLMEAMNRTLSELEYRLYIEEGGF